MHVPPIRRLRVLIDPAMFGLVQHDPGCSGGMSSWILLKSLENYLGQTREGVGLEFILPEGFLDHHKTNLYSVLLPPNRVVALKEATPLAATYFEGCTPPQERLIAIAEQETVDLLLTEDAALVKNGSSHLPNPPVLTVDWSGFKDVVECFLLGHGIYWSFTDQAYGRWLDTYFQTTNVMNVWLTHVHSDTAASIDADAKELLRSFAYNRYPFILLTRGLLQSYRWQALWYKRKGVEALHSFVKSFYLNWLYLLMWGALDHLSLILNRVHSYGFPERYCALNKPFREKMKQRHSALAAFLETEDIARFLMILSDLRHAAAHRVIPMPTSIVQDTDESTVPDEELRPSIEQELEEEIPGLPPALKESFITFRIQQRRIQKMKRLAESMVFVRKEKGGYFYEPYISADHDMECLNQIIRAFLDACFPGKLPTWNPQSRGIFGI